MAVTINGTTGIAGVDGSASTPAVQGTDTNTGIFFPAADTIAFGEGGAEVMRINSSGNVGIGVSPNKRLTVYSDDGYIQMLNASTGTGNTDGSFIGVEGGTTALRIVNQENDAISFSTNGLANERARITSGGKILFNTTTQNINEQVGMVYSSNAGVGFSIKDSNPQNGNTFIEFRNGATLAGTITSNGTTTMTYGSASDYRLKSNPQPIQNALATVSALNPVSFTWNQSGEQGIGFIAHEVQAVMPDCVVGQKDAEDDNGNPLYQMIDTGSASLIATLTAAIQELKSELDAAKARIAVLEAK